MKAAIFLLIYILSSGTGKAQPVKDSILIEGNYRTFSYYPPASKTAGSSLIFVLHGSGGSGKDMMKPAASLENISAKEKVLLVYADGYKHYWNECRKAATSEANLTDINEQAFFEAMISYFHKKYGTNNQHCFAIGLSGGGHMAYKLGLTMPKKFIAISAIVANLPDTMNMDCFTSKVPVAVLISNGTKDPLNHYEGGEIIINGKSWGMLLSAEKTFQYWAGLAGYTAAPVESSIKDSDTTNNQTITKYSYQLPGKPEVTLLKVNGGEHSFPRDIDIFIESLHFFKREARRKR